MVPLVFFYIFFLPLPFFLTVNLSVNFVLSFPFNVMFCVIQNGFLLVWLHVFFYIYIHIYGGKTKTLLELPSFSNK